MPMPTTRYGRFVFYKRRSQRREEHQRRHRNRGKYKKTAVRRMYWLWGKQVGPNGPIKPRWAPESWHYFPEFGGVVPNKGIFGVIPAAPELELPGWPNAHERHTQIGYQNRRGLSIPRVKQMPMRPYQYTHAQLLPWDYFPFEFYPSGQRSFASRMGWLG